LFCPPILRQPPITRRRKHRLPELLEDARHTIEAGVRGIQSCKQRLDGGDDAVLFGERGKGQLNTF